MFRSRSCRHQGLVLGRGSDGFGLVIDRAMLMITTAAAQAERTKQEQREAKIMAARDAAGKTAEASWQATRPPGQPCLGLWFSRLGPLLLLGTTDDQYQKSARVGTFKYLGLHLHTLGDVSHLIIHLKAKAAGSWAVVHSQLQHGSTVNVKLFLLQGILVPCLRYSCELWGMHIPCGAAQKAQVTLQSTYDRYLRHICRVKYVTP